MMHLQKKLVLSSVFLLITQLVACSSNDNSKASSLIWTSCEDVTTLECSTLKAPMDYSQPEGEKIDIALIRRVATGTDRKGSLLFNPGGPGASGLDFLKQYAEAGFSPIPDSILSAYDLVSFDPRGIGESTAVECSEEALESINSYPINEAAITEMHAVYSDYAASCSAEHGDILKYLGSHNVVRDMDNIRIEIGDDKLNFIGYSYGTRLAALYLQEFPSKSGRIVLDASGDPNSSLRTLLSGILPKKQENLLSVLSQCKITDINCDANSLLGTLVERVNTLSMPTTEAEAQEFGLLLGIASMASDAPEFGQFVSASLVEYLNTLDVSVLQLFVQQLNATEGDDDDEEEDNEDDEGSRTVNTAVLCADDASRPDVISLMTDLDSFNQVSDLFAELMLAQLGRCAGWPEAVEPLDPIVTNTAPLSLVIGGTSDSQAPIAASEEMASQIGGVFISSNHLGHTAVFNDNSDCVDDIVEAFLLDGMTPAVTTCE